MLIAACSCSSAAAVFASSLACGARVDEAEQVGGARGDELQADVLPNSGQHGSGAHGQRVAAMELRRDVGGVLRRPVALAMEAVDGAGEPPRRFFSVSATALSTCEHQ